MRVALFFICLCFLLLKGKGTVYAAELSHSSHPLHDRSLQQSQSVAVNEGKACAVITNAGTVDPNDYFTSDEAENEDSDNLFTRKFKLTGSSFSTLSFQSLCTYPFNRSKAAPSFYGRVSYKYILQRVLRV